MTVAPSTLRDLAAYWIAQGGVNLGIVGDAAHQARPSYHNGQDVINANGWTAVRDYSIRLARDREPNLTNAAAAIDLGKLDGKLGNLYDFSRWLVTQAQAGAPGTGDIREVIYSPDGKRVQRYSAVDGLVHSGWPDAIGNGDASHIFHTHISWFRDSQRRDKIGVFTPYFEKEVGVTHLYGFLDALKPIGIVTVLPGGPYSFVTPDGRHLPAPTGQQRDCYGKVRLLQPLPPAPDDPGTPGDESDRATAWLCGGIAGATGDTNESSLLLVYAGKFVAIAGGDIVRTVKVAVESPPGVVKDTVEVKV